jgi:hypothetical protein
MARGLNETEPLLVYLGQLAILEELNLEIVDGEGEESWLRRSRLSCFQAIKHAAPMWLFAW